MKPIEPRLQSDVLVLQLEILKKALADGNKAREHFMAGLMLEWHAVYYPATFGPVVEQCEQLVEQARESNEWTAHGYLLCAPLLLTIGLDVCRPSPVEDLPREIEGNLSHDSSWIRRWMMECVYWASRRVPAGDLSWAYRKSSEAHHGFLDDLALVIALCGDGIDVLNELQRLLPNDEQIGAVISSSSLGKPIANPFALRAAELMHYMFLQTLQLDVKHYN